MDTTHVNTGEGVEGEGAGVSSTVSVEVDPEVEIQTIVVDAEVVDAKVVDAEVVDSELIDSEVVNEEAVEAAEEHEEVVPSEEQTEFVAMPNLLHVKDEPLDEPEESQITESAMGLNISSTIAEPDPMNLLEMAEQRDFEEEEHSVSEKSQQSAANASGGGSVTVQPPAERWHSWMQEYRWLLHEADDNLVGYCLYCDVKLMIRGCGNLQKHARSLTHREKQDNYLAFKASEEEANQSTTTVEIKHEFGTSSSIAALKLKRISQAELLLNFNWRRWMQAHEWLERDQPDGLSTIGYCKYCCIKVSVELSEMRKRHEEKPKHKQAEQAYRRKQSKNGQIQHNGDEEEDGNDDDEEEEEEEEENASENASSEDRDEESDNDQPESTSKSNPNTMAYSLGSSWFKLVSVKRGICRCRLCHSEMHQKSFRKHLQTKQHIQNIRDLKAKKRINKAPATVPVLKVKQEFVNNFRNWKQYEKRHPWLIADPADPLLGYCKYCEKSLKFLHSVVKRALHENGFSHKNAAKEYINRQSGAADEDNSEEEAENNEEQENDEEEEEEEVDEEQQAEDDDDDDNDAVETEFEESEVDNKHEDTKQHKKKRLKRGSDEWFRAIPWLRKNPKNSEYVFCSYCDVVLRYATLSRTKHELSARHRIAEREYIKKAAKKQSHYQHALKDKRIHYYPWLVYAKNSQKSVFCKYCRVRFSSKFSRTSHQASKRHQAAAKMYAASKNDRKSPSETSEPTVTLPAKKPTTSPVVATSESTSKYKRVVSATQSMQARVKLWKHKFPWLTYKRDELLPHYGYCKFCEQRIYCPTLKYASKHSKSLKHIRIRMSLRHSQSTGKNIEEQATKSTNSKEVEIIDTDSPEKSTHKSYWENLQKRHPWLMSAGKTLHDGYCKYCDRYLKIVGNLRQKHETSNIHINNEKLYMVKDVNKSSEVGSSVASTIEAVQRGADAEDDDEDDDNDGHERSRSEPMDVDDVMEYLLRRTTATQSSAVPDEDDEIAPMDPPSKRAKTTPVTTATTAISSANVNSIEKRPRLSAAQMELLRLVRNLDGENYTPKKPQQKQQYKTSRVASILNSPLAFAACLSPFLQPVAQQATPPPPPPPSPLINVPQQTPERNTYDLFFQSMSETFKNMPADLASEGRIKVMQIIYDLELRALRRKQSSTESFNTIQITATPASTGQASPTRAADTPSTTTGTVGVSETEPNRTPIMDKSIELNQSSSSSSTASMSNNSDAVQLEYATTPFAATQSTFQRIQLNPAMQITSRNEPAATPVSVAVSSGSGGIRCIPINALASSQHATTTTTTTDNSSLPRMTRIEISPRTMPVSRSNGTFNHIQVNSRTQAKVITVSPNPQRTTQQQQQQRSVLQQGQIRMAPATKQFGTVVHKQFQT